MALPRGFGAIRPVLLREIFGDRREFVRTLLRGHVAAACGTGPADRHRPSLAGRTSPHARIALDSSVARLIDPAAELTADRAIDAAANGG